jgi:malonyl CoA-acyl carrier protein transacylase
MAKKFWLSNIVSEAYCKGLSDSAQINDLNCSLDLFESYFKSVQEHLPVAELEIVRIR